MNKKIIAIASLFSLAAFAAEAQLESLQPQVPFSAWRVMTGDSVMVEGPYHYAPGKHRSEISMEGQTFTAIVREDREVIWTLMPQQNMYMELGFDAREIGNGSAFEGSQIVESRELGSEILNGHQTTKYEVTVRDPSGQTAAGTLWATNDMIPVKMDMIVDGSDRFTVELRDIEVGPQADDLFEVPAGYTAFSLGSLGNLGNVFRNAAGNAGAQTAPRSGEAEAEEPGFAEGLATEAAEGARRGAEQGVREGVRENVGRRVRGLFNRN